MAIRCSLGFHDWKKNCEKCSICGQIRQNHHDWSADCEKCSKCGKTRKNQHEWKDDCEKCSQCNKTRNNQHNWSKNCSRCSVCGTIRPVKHSVSNGICGICHSQIITDPRDGQQYKIVKIGNQLLMAENLHYKLNTPGCFAYDNNELIANKYGYLYDFETAKLGAKNFPGWHLPPIEEWTTLFKFIGELDAKVKYDPGLKTFDGAYLNRDVYAKVSWKVSFDASIGFKPIKGGVRSSKGSFERLRDHDYFWSSSVDANNSFAFVHDEVFNYAGMERLPSTQALSIRLFRDS
jgi:uncharacterized protein (TIGR02145 family)